MKKSLVTFAIVIAIFVVSSLFGGLLVINKISSLHAVTGSSDFNMSGTIFLSVVLFCISSYVSYFVVSERHQS